MPDVGLSHPLIFSYCATFLPREMLHVYRQVTGVSRFENWVLTRTRANPASFPYSRLLVLNKHPFRALRRLWYRAQSRAVPLHASEVSQALVWAAEHRARLLHIYLGSEALRALPLLRAFPGARIVSFHGADLSHEFTPADYAKLWPQADLFLCRSESLRRDLLVKGCPADRIRLNFTGVPLPENALPRVAPVGRPVRLLQVCRFIDKKGLDVTIHAARRLLDQGVPMQLVLAGAGPAEANLRQLTEQLGLIDEVRFAGFTSGEALAQLYRESDLFLHPSRETSRGDREGIPNSILEAMAHALPVISTQHSGIPEAITHGVNGLLLEAAKPDLLASAILSLLRDQSLFGRISAGARHRIETSFSTEKCIEQLEKHYEEALAMH